MWEGNILVADIEELESSDATEIHAPRLNVMEVITPKSGETFLFQIADGTVKLSGGDQVFRKKPPYYGIIPNDTKSVMMIFEEKRTGLNH